MSESRPKLIQDQIANATVPLRIIQIHSSDSGGGAELVASMLHRQFLEDGHDSWLLVGSKRPDNNCARTLATPRNPTFRGELGLRALVERTFGLQGFGSPTLSGRNWPLSQFPDVILVHSVHGSNNYFRTEDLSWLARQAKTFVYLHDQWFMTGHCAYSLGCNRWKVGCGSCPDLAIYPSLKRDGTSSNWRRKQRIFSDSDIFVGSPARWILGLAKSSPILSMREQYWIPNGVDPKIFHSRGRADSRQKLGISEDSKVILFLAQQGAKSTFKDFETLATAFSIVRRKGTPVQLITVGGEPSEETKRLLPDDVRYFPYPTDREQIATYYRAADIFCHSTKADVSPLTIIESLSCGTPVVGTDVGGVRELVIPERTGWLVPMAHAESLAETLVLAVSDSKKLASLAIESVAFARELTIQRQAKQFIKLFREKTAREKTHQLQ